jgi:hypothetical protein
VNRIPQSTCSHLPLNLWLNLVFQCFRDLIGTSFGWGITSSVQLQRRHVARLAAGTGVGHMELACWRPQCVLLHALSWPVYLLSCKELLGSDLSVSVTILNPVPLTWSALVVALHRLRLVRLYSMRVQGALLTCNSGFWKSRDANWGHPVWLKTWQQTVLGHVVTTSEYEVL